MIGWDDERENHWGCGRKSVTTYVYEIKVRSYDQVDWL